MARGGSGGPVGAKTQKVSGSSTGTNATKKMDGYAKGPVPKSMIGTKNGINDKPGPYGAKYTGPNVQKGQFP